MPIEPPVSEIARAWELRLAGAGTLAQGNVLLPAFIADYNGRFAKPPAISRTLQPTDQNCRRSRNQPWLRLARRQGLAPIDLDGEVVGYGPIGVLVHLRHNGLQRERRAGGDCQP
jgi:hypothetical protein